MKLRLSGETAVDVGSSGAASTEIPRGPPRAVNPPRDSCEATSMTSMDVLPPVQRKMASLSLSKMMVMVSQPPLPLRFVVMARWSRVKLVMMRQPTLAQALTVMINVMAMREAGIAREAV